MKKQILGWVILGLLLLAMPASFVFGDHISEGLNQVRINFRNNSAGTLEHTQASFNLSSVRLADSQFIDANGLNADLAEDQTHIAFMPGSSKIQMLACFNNAGTNETTECNNDTIDDVTLPVTSSNVMEFAGDNQFNTLHFNITTPAVADWTITWEYWNGSSYVALANVLDDTDNFTTAGNNTVAFDFPEAGEWESETLHAIDGYWVRARVSAVSSFTSAPTASRVWYEVGRWWAIITSIETLQEVQYTAHLDPPDSDKTFHYYFPHTDGIVVTHDSTVSLTGSYVAEWTGYFDMTAPITGTTKKIGFKDAAIEITIPAAGIIQAKIFE